MAQSILMNDKKIVKGSKHKVEIVMLITLTLLVYIVHSYWNITLCFIKDILCVNRLKNIEMEILTVSSLHCKCVTWNYHIIPHEFV